MDASRFWPGPSGSHFWSGGEAGLEWFLVNLSPVYDLFVHVRSTGIDICKIATVSCEECEEIRASSDSFLLFL